MLLLLLSKVFSFFMSPAVWIFILILWRYFAINIILKKRLAVTAVIIFLVFSNEYILTKSEMVWQPKPVVITNEKFEAGIVLGGMSAYDKNNNGFFKDASDRFIQTCKLYHKGTIKKVIISGGSLWGKEPGEANFIKQELLAQGVADSNIIIENRSRNTFENVVYTKRLIDSMRLKGKILLITSAIHMPRAEGMFRKAGVPVTTYPCNYRVIDSRLTLDDYLLPKVSVLNDWNFLLKELAGTVLYKVTGKI